MDRPDRTRPEADAETSDSAPSTQDWGDDWVHELIAMTRPGADIAVPRRALMDRPVPFAYDDFS